MSGWIKISRSISSHWIWDDEKKLKMWIDLLLMANFTDKKTSSGFNLVECKRGQFITSLGKLSSRWRVCREAVRSFLTMLEKDTMVNTQSTSKYTQITICNYDKYQIQEHTDHTTDHTAKQTLPDTTKESKESKELNISFSDFWDLYNKKVGSKENCEKKWNKLTDEERNTIIKTLPAFLSSITDKQYQPYPVTYLNQKRWNDEISVQRVLTKEEIAKEKEEAFLARL